jgi:hypothetical protein
MFFDVFKKSNFAKLESFYLEQNHLDKLSSYPWMALAINQRSIAGSLLTKELVITPADSKKSGISFQLAEIESGLVHHVFNSSKKIFSGEIKNETEVKDTRVLFDSILDSLIEREIKFFTEQMNQSQFSPRQVENEEKALEWVRVSFEMLTKAVLESLTNPEYLFQTTFFAGINPKSGRHEMRLITFNLDMTFLMLDDNNLRVLIYNTKPGETAENLKPALTGDYSYKKREIFDQFINLLSAISKGMHA